MKLALLVLAALVVAPALVALSTTTTAKPNLPLDCYPTDPDHWCERGYLVCKTIGGETVCVIDPCDDTQCF